jgi:hypothetical protein
VIPFPAPFSARDSIAARFLSQRLLAQRFLAHRILAPAPAWFRSARHSKSCLVPRGDEAPPHHPSPGGASPQAGTAAPRVSDASPLSSATRAAVSAALSSAHRAKARVSATLMLAVALAAQASAQSIEERAQAAAQASRAKTSDSDALQKNYVSPGLSGQPMSTIDGSRSFVPDIACQKTATLLEMLVQPGSSGDITTLRISRDSNLDGAIDQTFNAGVPVSGICANGILSCEPGTWSGCRSFRWGAESGAISLAQVEMPELAGCYCINMSCGSNLVWGNMASVLKDLGGGVIGALTTADSRVGIAQAMIDGPVIRYVGAQAAACTADPAVTAAAYRANPSAIRGDAFAASEASSLFQSLAASPAGAGMAQERRACSVTREITIKEVTVDDVITRSAGGYSTIIDAAGNAEFLLGSPVRHSLQASGCRLFDFRMTLSVKDPARLKAASLLALAADDWAQVRIDGNLVFSGPGAWTGLGAPPGKCERDGTTAYAPGVDLMPYLGQGDHEIWLRVAVAGGGNAYAQIHAEVDTSCASSERIVDLCSGHAADGKCRLESERVDGVETVRGGVTTGLEPLALSRLFGTGACTLSLTRDFFEKKRGYLCTASSTGLPSPDLSRGAYIIDHSTETLLADRVHAADGGITASTRAFALPDRDSVAACEPVCKTRARAANTGAAPGGIVAARQNDPSGWDTFYHACDAQNRCPAGAGEEIVTACDCLDAFPEAVVMMQTVRLGGADLVCTGAAR